MPLLRLLLPIVAALALLGQSVSTYASAGLERTSTCCCPDPDTCACHDHDGAPDGGEQMSRCGQQAKLHVPAPLIAIIAAAEPGLETSVLAASEPPPPLAMLEPRTIEPTVPPF